MPLRTTPQLETSIRALRAQRDPSQLIGFVETALPAVRLFWADAPVARAPLSYAPGIAIIVSGHKIGFFEDRRIRYGPGQYLAVGLPLYFECETVATPQAPLIGLFLSIDPDDLRDLAEGLADHRRPVLPPGPALGIEPLTMGVALQGAVTRLAGQLARPAEAALLGPATLREIVFHALQDRHGRVLLSQTQRTRPEARIAQVLREIDRRPSGTLDIDGLADAAGMSPATLHRHFKAVTGLSPIRYQKHKRLMRAKSLLTYGNHGVAEAAHAVGYVSPAQFSRDFSSYFGMPPSRAHLSPYPA